MTIMYLLSPGSSFPEDGSEESSGECGNSEFYESEFWESESKTKQVMLVHCIFPHLNVPV